jgi:hypothetical protein
MDTDRLGRPDLQARLSVATLLATITEPLSPECFGKNPDRLPFDCQRVNAPSPSGD